MTLPLPERLSYVPCALWLKHKIERTTMTAAQEADLYDPKLGDMFKDGTSEGCSWRVEGIGVRTKLTYLRMFKDGKPTRTEVEWPRDRWPRFVDNQRLTVE